MRDHEPGPRWWVSAALLVAAGCAANPAPVPLTVDPTGHALLAGEWTGEFVSSAFGPGGSVSFSFVPHDTTQCGGKGEHGHGDVVFMTRPGNPPLHREEGEEIQSDTELPQVLSIQFLQVAGDEVFGSLSPYRDPSCGGCLVGITFQGRLTGDRMEGSFYTIDPDMGTRQIGTWKMTRKK